MTPDVDALFATAGWTVPGLLQARSDRSPDAIGLSQPDHQGEWQTTSWRAYQRNVAALARSLTRLGLAAGDRVGIIGPNDKAWDVAQLAVMAAGGVVVGLDSYGLDEHLQDVAERCAFTALIVGDSAELARLGDRARSRLRFVVCFGASAEPGLIALSGLLAEAAEVGTWNLAQPDAPATIIFTSGTTGRPKGIEYTQRQMCAAAAAMLASFPDTGSETRTACWLPLANLFQRMINIAAIGCGAQTFYVADPRDLMRHIAGIAPHTFIGIPRFFEKLSAGIDEAIGKKPAWQQNLVHWSLAVGDRRARARREGQAISSGLALRWSVAERLVLKKLRATLGGNLRYMISGSAPLAISLLERFDAIGVPIYEAYGLSENIVPIAISRRGACRFGSVGRPTAGNEVRLAADGELLVRGPGVFSGYFGESRVAGAVENGLDSEGFYHSGDHAQIDADGFITLLGRKSAIFKTSTGRRVAPDPIEGLLLQIAGVEQAFVWGSGRTLPLALLVVSDAVWQLGPGALGDSLRLGAAAALATLPRYLNPAALAVTTRPFSITGGELTSNLKMRRANIEKSYAALLDELSARVDAADGTPFAAPSRDSTTLLISL